VDRKAPVAGARLQIGLKRQRAWTLFDNAQTHSIEANQRSLNGYLAVVCDIESEDAPLVAARFRVRNTGNLLDRALQVQRAREARHPLNHNGGMYGRLRIDPFGRCHWLIGVFGLSVVGLGVFGLNVVGLGVFGLSVFGLGVFGLGVFGLDTCLRRVRFRFRLARGFGSSDELSLCIRRCLGLTRGVSLAGS
jgi:hypothetical protein